MIDVLPLVEWPEREIVGKPSEGVDEMRAQVRIDVLRHEFGQTWTVRRPVGVVAHDSLGTAGCARLQSCAIR